MKQSIIVFSFAVFFIHCNQSQDRGSTISKSPAEKNTVRGKFVKKPSDISHINFRNPNVERWDRYIRNFNYMYNGAGVAVGDINNDGLPDIYLVANTEPNKLYLNQGNFVFEDITEKAKVGGGTGWHTAAIMVDINHDGLLDIYVTRGGWKDSPEERANLLFVNKGNLTFKEEARYYGIDDKGYSIDACFFDMDNDNDLDLYVTNRPATFKIGTDDVLAGRDKNHPYESDQLYKNGGKLSFKNVSKDAGITHNFGYGLSVSAGDLNHDGFQDLYICNDFIEHDYCYLNQGDGTFKESIKEITNHTSYFSMGSDIQDINNDGFEDITTTEMLPEDYWRAKVTMAPMTKPLAFNYMYKLGHFQYQYMHNTLQLNRRNGFFSEISNYAGIKHTDWSWAVLASDFDNDGMRDIFIANGYKRDVFDNDATARIMVALNKIEEEVKHGGKRPDINEMLKIYESNPLQNYMFKNLGDYKFENLAESWGLEEKSFSNGAATGDFDGDGDLDLIINNLEGVASLYENQVANGNYLKIRLIGPSQNTFGIGAKITVKTPERSLFEDFQTSRGYVSSVEPVLHFGLGNSNTITEVTVRWPDGKLSVMKDLKPNQYIQVKYREATEAPLPQEKPASQYFTEITDQNIIPPYIHQDNNFEDFKYQVLLPHGETEHGPPLAVGDVNGDGMEDFFIGGSFINYGAIYTQDKSGQFHKTNQALLQKDKDYEDTVAVFFDVDKDGDLDLYVASGSSEYPANDPHYQDRLYLNDGKGNFNTKAELPKIGISGSVVRPYDYDGDGDIDVFVGGRILPRFYPAPTNSLLLRNDGGKLVAVSDPAFVKLGMVTDAIWQDVNADKQVDLILCGEWMPLTVLMQKNGHFVKTNYPGLEKTTGWWFRLASGDLDGDGDIDLIGGNLGENYKFHASEKVPFHIYADDFDGDGSYDPYLAKNHKGKLKPIRGRQCSSEELNYIKDKFPTYRAFAAADVDDILGKKIEKAMHYEAYLFSHTFFGKQSNSYSKHRLPTEPQFSVINGILIKDFNKDGKPDVLIAGNMFESEPETTCADANIGSLLLNMGNGEWENIEGGESGFFVPYNVRDLQEIHLGKDSKTAILVPVNNGKLRLFQLNENPI